MPLKFMLNDQKVEEWPSIDPALVDRFRSSIFTFRALGAEHVTMAERIQNGVAFCKQNPRNKDAFTLLAQLREQQQRLLLQLDTEAVLQSDLEIEILTAAGLTTNDWYVCARCFEAKNEACGCRELE